MKNDNPIFCISNVLNDANIEDPVQMLLFFNCNGLSNVVAYDSYNFKM